MLFNRIWNSLGRISSNQFTQSLRSRSTKTSLATTSTTNVTTTATKPTVVDSLNVFAKVNSLIANRNEGRLFAVVHLCGKQFKVTTGDIILVEGYWPPNTGDKLTLDKVLVAGGQDFSIIGRPIIPKDLINVQATIIEKTLTHTKTHFKKKRRKQYMRINFYRSSNTMIMINSIDIRRPINDSTSISQTNELKIF